jgi:Fe-S cluster biogenesis protein NfuA
MGLLDILNNFMGEEPTEPATGDPARIREVEAILADLRPMLEMDGGNIHLISIGDSGEVLVKLSGACTSCSAQSSTLYDMVQPKLLNALPWIASVEMA